MTDLEENIFLLNVKAEVDAMKRREIALLYALQEMEKEKIEMHAKLYDSNRCSDCIRLNDCALKNGPKSPYKAKQRTPEAFCTMWAYKGNYTPLNEIMTIARKTH